MSQDYNSLSQQLMQVIHKMQKIQARISGSHQPAAMHELDELKRLGKDYAVVLEQLAQLNVQGKTQQS